MIKNITFDELHAMLLKHLTELQLLDKKGWPKGKAGRDAEFHFICGVQAIIPNLVEQVPVVGIMNITSRSLLTIPPSLPRPTK